MKYVIWGAGQRGKMILNILGERRVLFFVDSDPEKAGTVYCNKEVKSADGISAVGEDCIIIISPAMGVNQIIDRLESMNIKRYMCLDDCPYFIELNKQDILEDYDINPDFVTCGIYGIGWFSLYLYEYLTRKNVQVCLVPHKGIAPELLDCIEKEYAVKPMKDVGCVEFLLIADGKRYAGEIVNGGKDMRAADVNDYFEACGKVYNEKILEYKGIHNNERCFIVATGPSLCVDDLNTLHDNHEICISMNRIYNIFSKTEWRPDYYVIEDKKMIEDLSEELAGLELPHKFVPAEPASYWELENAQSSIKFNMIMQNYDSVNMGFSRYLEKFVYNGRTVTYACLQLAAYMGFREIYLLGVDFNYTTDIYAACNHFEGYHNYYKEIRLNDVYPELQQLSYERAKQACELQGIKIYNATRGGKLEVFERKSFDKLFGRGNCK